MKKVEEKSYTFMYWTVNLIFIGAFFYLMDEVILSAVMYFISSMILIKNTPDEKLLLVFYVVMVAVIIGNLNAFFMMRIVSKNALFIIPFIISMCVTYKICIVLHKIGTSTEKSSS